VPTGNRAWRSRGALPAFPRKRQSPFIVVAEIARQRQQPSEPLNQKTATASALCSTHFDLTEEARPLFAKLMVIPRETNEHKCVRDNKAKVGRARPSKQIRPMQMRTLAQAQTML
jgi:hypothetical protein